MIPIEIGKHCLVQVIDEIPSILIKWDGLPSSIEFRNGCNKVLELMKLHGIIKVITDNRQAKVFSMNDQRWLNEEWLPKAKKIGYRYSAVIVKEDNSFVTFAVKNILSKRDSSVFEAKLFNQYDDAVGWLKST